MSLPPRVLCRSGCGDFGDPELEFLCGDCHGDKTEIDKQKALREYVQSKKANKVTNSVADGATNGASSPDSAALRRRPPSINHRKAFEEFLDRTREKDDQVVVRECVFLEREIHIRDMSKLQLRRFMVATDLDEAVDPKEWGRYQYGEPRDVPRHDVDTAIEMAAQVKLFCNWRRRTVARSLMSRKQIIDGKKKADAEAKNSERTANSRFLPKLSKPSLSVRSLKRSLSAAHALVATAADSSNSVSAGKASEKTAAS